MDQQEQIDKLTEELGVYKAWKRSMEASGNQDGWTVLLAAMMQHAVQMRQMLVQLYAANQQVGQQRTCLDCKFLCLEPGYKGFYPGETTYPDLGCSEQVWRGDFEDDEKVLRRNLQTARSCTKFQPPEEP